MTKVPSDDPSGPEYMIMRALEILLAAVLVLGLFVGVPILALSGVYALNFGHCIRFPSGVEIGYEANLSFTNPYLIPDVVLREPGGKVIGWDIWPVRVTDQSVSGRALPDREGDRLGYSFIWTSGTGVVREDADPDLYNELMQNPGEERYGVPEKLAVDTGWLLKRFERDPRFRSDDCSTRLWVW